LPDRLRHVTGAEPSNDMPIVVESEVGVDGRSTVTVRGEIDIATVSVVAEQLERVLTDDACITVDLRPIDFLDCSALRVLLAARRQAQARGGDLVVVATPRWARVIDLAGVDLRLIVDVGRQPDHKRRSHLLRQYNKDRLPKEPVNLEI